MLLRGLDDLCYKFFETLVVDEDDERVTQQVQAPFADGDDNGIEFVDVCGGMLQSWTKRLVEENDRMVILHQNSTHGQV